MLWMAFLSFAYANQPVISILTCDPGKEVYSMYGHNALRIQFGDGRDIVFNYGTFDFQTPNFTLKFLRGKLPYYLTAAHFQDFMYEYNYFERSVTEQIINLDSTETEKIISFLDNNLKPENRAYKYDFFYDNCATRIYDVINVGAEKDVVWPMETKQKLTFRDIIKHYQKNFPWTDFGIDIIIGAKADKEATVEEQMFIPDFVKKYASETIIRETPLVLREKQLLEFNKEDISFLRKIFFGPLLVFLLLMAFELFLFISKKANRTIFRYDHFWFGLLVFIGIVILIMWFLTDHEPTKNNWNILWTIPGFLYFLFRKSGYKYFIIITGIVSVLTIINSFTQILPQYFHPIFGIIAIITMFKVLRKFIGNEIPAS